MRVGMHLGYQNLNDVPDAEKFMQEMKLAIEAEAMGFEPLVRRAWVIDLVPPF